MPILDLIASITGEKPATPSPNPPPRPSVMVPKRKAEDELRAGGVKTARTDSPADRTSRPSSNSPRPSPRPAERTLGTSSDKTSKSQAPLSKPASNDRPKPSSLAVSSTAKAPTTGAKPLPTRPAGNRPSPTDSGPPKKRSFKEIMSRAQANSEQRESLGKIQHKTVERSLTMKERKELKAEEARKARVAARKGTSGRPGATMALPRDAAKSPGPRDRVPPSGSAISRKSAPVEEKKVKKAALATTGYTGTARPRPGSSTLAKPASSRPSSDARARDRSRYGGSGSRNRYEEEDEDMDDFIEYDDEEEPPEGYRNGGRGGGYRYDSYEDESDMEAGLSDIEDEEQLADRQARREDLEQEALEKRLKQEKEERRRKLLSGNKSKAGGR